MQYSKEIMTNADKAFELLNKLDFEDGKYEVTDALIDMGEWKDKEFLSIIEDKLNYARDMIKEKHGKSVCLKYEGMRKILIEIKNELNAK